MRVFTLLGGGSSLQSSGCTPASACSDPQKVSVTAMGSPPPCTLCPVYTPPGVYALPAPEVRARGLSTSAGHSVPCCNLRFSALSPWGCQVSPLPSPASIHSLPFPHATLLPSVSAALMGTSLPPESPASHQVTCKFLSGVFGPP
jgi:hypothetical protein